FREHHGPRNIRRPAEKLTVDEIPDPAQAQAHRDRSRDEICDLPEIPSFAPGDIDRREKDANEPSMERHASLPDGEYRPRLKKVIVKIVKEDIAETSSDHDAENQIKQQVIQVVARQVQLSPPGIRSQQEVADDKRHHVHQAVPPQLDRPDAKEHGINVWIGNDEHHGCADACLDGSAKTWAVKRKMVA